MNHWRMHKLGFINFWLYDVEEFIVTDGHILLRGSNASGKSITTQSFIPFLLDGNKSPERLDPFGSRERRMDYYLLGDGERDESTGYLYLEFKKNGLEEYLTIGVGMRAQKGKGIDFWGFCLCDGRRIGPEGIQLYQTIGNQKMPLSKQKLKLIINDEANWVESPGTYKQLVNDRVFQFREIKQYDQLIQLLIKVRAPKLSKDAFRPSEVKKVLNDSLQVLTDEDLSAMVSTMERMDALKDTLQDYRAAMRDADTIQNEYRRYNHFILGMKAKDYLEASVKTDKLKLKLQDAQGNCETQETDLQEQTRRGEEAAIRLEQARAQRVAMGDDDLTEKRRQLVAEQGSRKLLQQQLSETDNQLEKIQQGIAQKEVALRTRTKEQEDARYTLRSETKELEELNRILALGEEHERYVKCLNAERLVDTDQQIHQDTLNKRKKRLSENVACLKDVKEAQTAYDGACQALDQAATATAAARRELRDAELQEQEERDRLTEDIVQRQSMNQELLFSQAELVTLRQAVVRYHSPADWSSVRDLYNNCYAQRRAALKDHNQAAEKALREIQKELEDIQRQLRIVRSKPVPVPPRNAQIEATRTHLAFQGIPCSPFYETIDFRPGLSQKEQDLLEAQLTDAGLLDALVVLEEHRQQIVELLAEYPDRFLTPGPPVDEPVAALVPDESNPLSAMAARCLRGISRSDLTSRAALLPDGSFSNGAIRGHSLAENPAGYVGATARRINRERQIRLLEEQISEAERKQSAKQEEIDALSRRLKLLDDELSAIPTTNDLDQALDLLAQAQKGLKAAQEEETRRSGIEQDAKHQLAQLEQKSRDLSRDLPYARTLDAYEEASDAASEYGNLLSTLYGAWQKLLYAMRAVSDLADVLDEQRDQVDQMQKRQVAEQRMLGTIDAKIRQIQEFLDKPENRERAQRLAELDQEISDQDAIGREVERNSAALKVGIQSAESEVARIKEDVYAAEILEHNLEQYFTEDLSLGFVMTQDNLSIFQCARQAQSKIQAADRERTPEWVGASLRNNFQQHNNTLLKYSPKIDTVFDSPSRSGMLRQRLAITLQKDGKELSLQAFVVELQKDIDLTEVVLEEKDRELFEDILTDTISHKLRARIEESQKWSRDMSALMRTLDTSMGLTFSLDWKAKKAEGPEELDTAQLVSLLNKDRVLLTREDGKRVSAHFRSRLKTARQKAEEEEQEIVYADLIREVLDYRTWYEFLLYYLRNGEVKRELTDRIFNTFSGGEKAMAIYLPQFAAVSAQYQKAGPCSPNILALDEAFAGVDEKNIGAMFELVHTLDFDYIMNSQTLWGCYSCVPSLDIAEFHRPNNAQVVTILKYRWNGKERTLLEESGETA